MLQGKVLRMADEEEGGTSELSLELSIGGSYGKSKQTTGIGQKPVEFCLKMEEDCASERRIREERLKKLVNLGSCGSVNVPIVEDKEWSDPQTRFRERENENVLEIEPALKKGKIGSSTENVGSNAMAPAVLPVKSINEFVNNSVVLGGGQAVARIDEEKSERNGIFRLKTRRSLCPFQSNRKLKFNDDDMECGGVEHDNANSDGSPGSSSSGFSYNQRSSGLGGSATEDSRSNSSHSQLDQQLPNSSAASDVQEQTEHAAGTSKMIESTTPITPKLAYLSVCKSTLAKPSEGPESDCQPPDPISTPISTDTERDLPPKPEHVNLQAFLLAKMPCVSTTGNGPNGKTVNGFLYRCTKSEVNIVCICHGSSFSPAGFVEHAGGVNIVHPLRHITIFPIANSRCTF